MAVDRGGEALARGCLGAILLWAIVILVVVAVAQAAPRVWHASSTAYCLNGTMANGHRVHWGAVASNRHRLGTRIRMKHKIRGRRYFTVEDRIGYGSDLDVWMGSCHKARQYGRRHAMYTVVR